MKLAEDVAQFIAYLASTQGALPRFGPQNCLNKVRWPTGSNPSTQEVFRYLFQNLPGLNKKLKKTAFLACNVLVKGHIRDKLCENLKLEKIHI